MKKQIKKITIIISFMLFCLNSANASLLWNIDYGIEQYKKNNYNSAKDFFISYIKNNPNDKDGYYWLAKTYQKLEKKTSNSALDNFKKAYELLTKEKNIEEVEFNIKLDANIEDYFDMAAMFFEAGNVNEADSYADMMLKINPKSSSAYFIKAKVAHLNKDDKKAKEYLNLAIVHNNELIKTNLAKSLEIIDVPQMTVQMYSSFALEAYFVGDLENAIKYFKKYCEAQGNNPDVLNLFVDAYVKNNQIFEAQNLINDILKNNPNNIQALLYKSKYSQIDEDDKEENLLKVYEINPNNQQVLLELGNFYLKKSDYQNSKKYFEVLINVNDEMPEAYFGYINSLIELGELKDVLQLIRKATTLNNASSENYFLLAKYCKKQGNFTEAQEYIKEAILKDENSNYYFELGKINYFQKKYSQALINFKDAKEISAFSGIGKDVDSYLIKAYLKNNDRMNALNLLSSKSTLDKSRIIYKYNLYVLSKLQGDDLSAQSYYKQIKKSKLTKTIDYIDLSEVYLELKGLEQAIKVLDKGIKKHPDDLNLYYEKIKLYSIDNQQEKIQEIMKLIEENLNSRIG